MFNVLLAQAVLVKEASEVVQMTESDDPDGIGTGRILTLQSTGALKTAANCIGVVVALAGLAVLLGWVLQIPLLRTLSLGSVTMKADAAICFLFTGIALWLLRIESPQSPAQKAQRYIAYWLALLVLMTGLLTMLEYIFNWNIGLDQLFVRDLSPAPGTAYPGRMAPYAAVNFFIIGLCLLLLDVKSRGGQRPSSYLIAIVGVTSLGVVIGYIYGVPEFRGEPTPLALSAAAAFLLVFAGVLLVRPAAGITAVLFADYPAGLMLRLLVPGLIILVILTGWLRLQGEVAGYYSARFGLALFSLVNTLIGMALLLIAAKLLSNSDLRRRRADAEIRQLNAGLEKQVEERTTDLRKSEEKYRSIFENSVEGIYQTTLEGRFISVNPAFARICGFESPGEMINSISDIRKQIYVHAEDRDRLMALLRTSDAVRDFEVEMRRRDGSTVWVSTNIRPVRGRDGRIAYTEGALIDITERKHIEEALKGSEELYRSLFENMLNGFAYCRMFYEDGKPQDFAYLAVNGAFEKLTGLKDVVGKRVSEVIPGIRESDPQVFEVYGRVALTGAPEVFETYVKALKMWFYISVYSPVKECFVAVFDVITERKLAEEALKSSEARYRELFDHMASSVAVYEAAGNGEDFIIRDFNRPAERLEKVRKEDIVGRSVRQVFPGVVDFGLFDVFKRVWRTGVPEYFPVSLYRDARILGWRENYVYKLPSGEIVAIYDDVTERMQAAEKLQEQKLELERSNTELERFAYVASHDLQEPLRTISSYLQLLERRYLKNLDENATRYINFTVDAANRLQNMIGGLLEYSRVETRGQPFEPVNFESVLRQTVENLHSAVAESGAGITHDPLPTVMGDRGQLSRLFQNLLANSIRYRSQEPPRIHVSAVKQDSEWVLSVKDNGVGIDPEYKDQIFLIFQRLHGRDVPGIGLGLSIAKRIVERHGGRIWVESEPGKGATFYFTIPAQGGTQN
jgi:PAS domain S-box-containing protein